MKDVILTVLEAGITAKRRCIENNVDKIIQAVEMLVSCIDSGNKILIFGNGGSAADAQHLAAEFVNRFQIERPPIAAIALTTDTSVLTSIGNDYHFDEIFAKQIQALGKPGDIAWGISTSGNSSNVLKAVKTARQIGLGSIGMTGPAGRLAEIADIVFAVDSGVTAAIQETHITLGHIMCHLVDRRLYPEKFRD